MFLLHNLFWEPGQFSILRLQYLDFPCCWGLPIILITADESKVKSVYVEPVFSVKKLPRSRTLVFVLDTSNSMNGTRLFTATQVFVILKTVWWDIKGFFSKIIGKITCQAHFIMSKSSVYTPYFTLFKSLSGTRIV